MCIAESAAIPATPRRQPASIAQSPFPFPNLYRAHVEPAEDSRSTERNAFVEAAGHRDAVRKIAAAVAALKGCLAETVIENRIYNCASARELMDEGSSQDVELRLFETG